MKQASRPTVSVLIPCYNHARCIGQVIQAALDQTRPPDEIIVVNDASTDQSVEVIRRYPVKLLTHERNRGPATARNTALEASVGDIVLYIDADAYADSRLIEVLLEVYRQHSRASLGGVGGRGIESNIQTVYDRWRAIHARQDFGSRPRTGAPYLIGLCASYRREALLDVGGFDPLFPFNAGEDTDVGYRLNRAGYQLHYAPQAIVYHQHTDTHESLRRTQYNWTYWSYIAKRRSNWHPWTSTVGAVRRVFTYTIADLLLRHDLELARLDLEIFAVKMKALRDASRSSSFCRSSASVLD